VVVRGDVHSIIVGRNVNIQDNSTVHSDLKQPTVIGDGVSVGHNAVVHGCTVGKGALIGIHATVLSGAKVGVTGHCGGWRRGRRGARNPLPSPRHGHPGQGRP